MADRDPREDVGRKLESPELRIYGRVAELTRAAGSPSGSTNEPGKMDSPGGGEKKTA